MHTLNLITLLHKIHCCSYLLMIYSHSLARDHHCKSVNKTECGVLTWKNTEQLSIYIYVLQYVMVSLEFGPHIFSSQSPCHNFQLHVVLLPRSKLQYILLVKNHIVIMITSLWSLMWHRTKERKESQIFLRVDEFTKWMKVIQI